MAEPRHATHPPARTERTSSKFGESQPLRGFSITSTTVAPDNDMSTPTLLYGFVEGATEVELKMVFHRHRIQVEFPGRPAWATGFSGTLCVIATSFGEYGGPVGALPAQPTDVEPRDIDAAINRKRPDWSEAKRQRAKEASRKAAASRPLLGPRAHVEHAAAIERFQTFLCDAAKFGYITLLLLTDPAQLGSANVRHIQPADATDAFLESMAPNVPVRIG